MLHLHLAAQACLAFVIITGFLFCHKQMTRPHFLPKLWGEYSTAERVTAYAQWFLPHWTTGAVATSILLEATQHLPTFYVLWGTNTLALFPILVVSSNWIEYQKWCFSIEDEARLAVTYGAANKGVALRVSILATRILFFVISMFFSLFVMAILGASPSK